MRQPDGDSMQRARGLDTIVRDAVGALAAAPPTARSTEVDGTLARLAVALGAHAIHVHDDRPGVEVSRTWPHTDAAPPPPPWPTWTDAEPVHVDEGGGTLLVRLGDQRWPGFLAVTGASLDLDDASLVLLGIVGEALLASLRAADDDDDVEAFARVAAHDLKSPLSTMRMALNSLAKMIDDPIQSQLLGASLRSSDRMVELIESLLDYATAGSAMPAADTVDLSEVVQDAVADLGLPDGSVAIDPMPSVPGSRARLRSLFQNLIGNAQKFHRPDQETSIIVRCSVDADNDTVTVVVDDDGIGIPQASRDAVFAPFVRLGAREKFSGSGIGLASCRRVVESHNGRIWVEESSRGGTAVHVELPLTEPG